MVYTVKDMARIFNLSASYIRTIIYTQAKGIVGKRVSAKKGGHCKVYSEEDFKKIQEILKNKLPVGRPKKG